MKKAVSFLIAIQLTALLAAPAFAIDTTRSNYDTFSVTSTSIQNEAAPFSDVPTSYWGYKTIMRAQELGLMNGVGDNKFNPEGSMTREQFITVAVRAIDKDSEAQAIQSAASQDIVDKYGWSYGYFRVATKYGLIASGLFDNANKDVRETPMTRAEMAYVIKNALEIRGESLENGKVVPLSNIPDIGESGNYSNAVQFCYSKGVLVGVDTQGNYNPQGVLKRNAGATVAVRLVDASARKTPNFDAKPQQSQQSQQQQTPQGTKSWVEGERHGMPQVGDKITSKSGQTFIINEQYGVLGANVNADIWTNAMDNGYPCKVGEASPNDMTPLVKDNRTGQVHSTLEWKKIQKEAAPSGMVGDYDGEVYNDWYKWNSELSRWQWMGPNLSGK